MRRPSNIRTLSFEELETRTMLDGTNYFVATNGSDGNDGLTPTTAWRTVLRATRNSALMPGDTINILPGVYADDGVWTLNDGAAGAPITVRADGGPVTIQGGILSNAWTLYNAANNVYVLNFDSTGLTPYFAFCGYATTAFGYGAMTNIGSTFLGHLPDPGGNYNFDSDPSAFAQLLNPPPALVNQCFCFWTGSLVGNFTSGTQMYLHAPPGWTQQDVSTNVFIGDASKAIDVNNNYWTFDHITMSDAFYGFNIVANNLTVTNCTIQNIYLQSFFGGSNDMTFDHNLIESVGQQYTPTPTLTPAITISYPNEISPGVQFAHDVEGDLITTLYEDGQTTGRYVMSSVQTLGDLGQFFQGLGYTISLVGNPTQSCQFLLNSFQINVSQPETFQSASWSLIYPLGSYYHGIYFGGNDNVISNSTFTNINGNGISYRYGNNYTIDNNIIDNDLGGLLNVGGSNISVYNNLFRSTVDAGNGINLAYGGNGGTIEFEQNTVAVANRLTLGFLETAGSVNSSNWAIIGNIFENILPNGTSPIEMYIGATPNTNLANWTLRDNVYWIGDENNDPLPFQLFLAVSTDGAERGYVFTSWSDYISFTSYMWGWEQDSLNVDPQLDANYVPQNPVVIVLGAGAVLQNTATWSSTDGNSWSGQDSWTEDVVGPEVAPGLSSRLDDTDTANFDGGSSITTIDLTGMTTSLSAIDFSDLNYMVEGGVLALDGSTGPATSNPATVTVGSGTQTIASPITLASDAEMTIMHTTDQLAISGAIGGNGGLSKQGDGVLTLSGDNTYAGSTVVAAGTLVINSAAALPAGASLTIGSAPTLAVPEARVGATSFATMSAGASAQPLSTLAQDDGAQNVDTSLVEQQAIVPAAVDIVHALAGTIDLSLNLNSTKVPVSRPPVAVPFVKPNRATMALPLPVATLQKRPTALPGAEKPHPEAKAMAMAEYLTLDQDTSWNDRLIAARNALMLLDYQTATTA